MATWNNLTDYLKDLGSTIKHCREIPYAQSLNAQNFASEIAKIGIYEYSSFTVTPAPYTIHFSAPIGTAVSTLTVLPIPVTSIEVTPSTASQIITTPSDYLGFESFMIRSVTSDLDSNIQPQNIAGWTSILGVQGNYFPSSSTLVIYQKSYSQSFEPSQYDCEGFSVVTIRKIIPASLDIISYNIRESFNILGVTGTYGTNAISYSITLSPNTSQLEGPYFYSWQSNPNDNPDAAVSSLQVNIPTQAMYITPSIVSRNYGYDQNIFGLSRVQVNAVTSSLDSNLISDNIKKDISIFGVVGNYEASFPISQWLNGQLPSFIENSTSYLKPYAFCNCSTLISLSLPECLSVGANAFISCRNLKTLSLNKCIYIDAESSVGSIFKSCFSLSTIYLDQVSQVTFVQTFNVRNWLPNTVRSIYVPSSLYSDFLVASGWSRYSEYIMSV